MAASPLKTLPGRKCRLYVDLRAAGTADYDTPVWTEVGLLEEGEHDPGIETTELSPRIGRGLTMEVVSGFKPITKGKITYVTNPTTDIYKALLDRCTDPAKLGDQILVAQVTGDITVVGTRGTMMWAVVKVGPEKQGKDVVQSDIEFMAGLGDTAGNTYEPILVAS